MLTVIGLSCNKDVDSTQHHTTPGLTDLSYALNFRRGEANAAFQEYGSPAAI
jgi:hypothetical protein